jgi:hypothetical protein
MSTDPTDRQVEVERHHRAVEHYLAGIESHLADLVDVLREYVPDRRDREEA